MAFCVNCGHQINNEAKFCTNCGQVIMPHKAAPNERKPVCDGEIYQCPSCGKTVDSFVLNCPACGYEFRDTKATISLQQFYWDLHKLNTMKEKSLMIRNFPIPNSKEDIIEFMILASSNVKGEANKEIFEAWVAKMEQAYQKSQLTLYNDPAFSQIAEIYEKTEKTISKGRIIHVTNSAGGFIKQCFHAIPNAVFAIVAVLLIIYNIIRLVNGEFAGIDIIFDVILLGATYGITKRKKN